MQTPRSRLFRHLLVISALLVLLLALRHAGEWLIVSVPAEAPDAIVSLASHEWERLPAAARLARRHCAIPILLTTPSVVTESNCHRCSERVEMLAEEGVAGQRIHLLAQHGSNTYEEATATLAYARQEVLRELIVVTSPYHTRRARAAFRKAFDGTDVRIGVYPATTDSPARPATWWRHEYDRSYVIYELAALAYYMLSYRVWPF